MSSIVPDVRVLLVDFQTQLRGIAGLVSELDDDTSNVVLYDDDSEGDLGAKIKNLVRPTCLIYLAGIIARPFPARMRVSVGMAIRRAKNITAIYAAIAGEPSTASGADGQPLIASNISPKWSPMEVPQLERRFITFGHDGIFDYWDIQTSFTDKGF